MQGRSASLRKRLVVAGQGDYVDTGARERRGVCDLRRQVPLNILFLSGVNPEYSVYLHISDITMIFKVLLFYWWTEKK